MEKEGDEEAVEELLGDLNSVKISKEDAGAGLEQTLAATGAKREEWAGHVDHAAKVCEAHLGEGKREADKKPKKDKKE